MFAAAYGIATGFTRPVIISRLRVDGTCDAAIGSFIVVNNEGWILTAAHIIEEGTKSTASQAAYKEYLAEREAIENSKALLLEQKKKKLRKMAPFDPRGVQQFSYWWSWDNATIKDVKVLAGADVAVGRLDPFDA